MDENNQAPNPESHRTIMIVAAVAVIAVVVAAGIYYWFATQKEKAVPTNNQPVVKTPTELPSANPLEKTNPLEGTYQNPFE